MVDVTIQSIISLSQSNSKTPNAVAGKDTFGPVRVVSKLKLGMTSSVSVQWTESLSLSSLQSIISLSQSNSKTPNAVVGIDTFSPVRVVSKLKLGMTSSVSVQWMESLSLSSLEN